MLRTLPITLLLLTAPAHADDLAELLSEHLFRGSLPNLRHAAAAGTLGSTHDRATWSAGLRSAIRRLRTESAPAGSQIYPAALLDAFFRESELTPSLCHLLRISRKRLLSKLRGLRHLPRVLWLAGSVAGLPRARALSRGAILRALPRTDLPPTEVERVARLAAGLLVHGTEADHQVLTAATRCDTAVCLAIARNVAVLEGAVQKRVLLINHPDNGSNHD